MVELHQRYTQSKVAELLLNDWENNLEKFVKVMPQDYKRVMAERREHNEEIESIFEVKDRQSERPGV
jgi:glutamate synthase domain-containing protein 3